MLRSSETPISATDQRYRECLDNARRLCAASAVPSLLIVGAPDMAALRCNAALAALLDRPRAATRDETGPTLLAAGWPALVAALRPLYEGGERPDFVTLRVPPALAGAPPLTLRAVPLTVDGAVVAALAVSTLDDAVAHMTATMRAEVERTTAARSRFLASASHDLRQPFQAMRLFLDALSGQVAGNARAVRTAGMLGNAMTAGERLLNALLDISTLDAGTVEPDLQTVALDGLLNSLADEFRPQAAEKGLRLRVHVPRATTRSDPVLLGRIVRNLLANAIRYTQRGGILLSVRRRDGRWRVEVWDTGFGIPPDKQDVIFDEFHQLTNPSRDPTRGLGLGLAIVRRLSVLLHAPVEVQSRAGRGSVFAVTVDRVEEDAPAGEPVPDPAGPAATAGPAAGVSLAGMRILVVDDDSMVLSGLLLTLESWGCAFVSASDMREVFAAVDGLEGPPDAILTDLRLPGKVSGFDVIDRVRKLFRTAIPAVVLTGETAPDALLEGQRRGCAFLHKPLHPGELRRVLEELRGTAAPGA